MIPRSLIIGVALAAILMGGCDRKKPEEACLKDCHLSERACLMERSEAYKCALELMECQDKCHFDPLLNCRVAPADGRGAAPTALLSALILLLPYFLLSHRHER